MRHWDRDTSGRLQRIRTPVDQGCEISVHSDQMDPLPEEQQSQQGTPVNPTEYRSMRDHIHPPRVSAPTWCPCFPHFMVWRMKIHTLISGILRKYA